MTRGSRIQIKSSKKSYSNKKLKNKPKKTLKINDLVYVAGDYFDYDEKNRWSKNVAKIDYTKSSLIGLVKSFDIHNNQRYSNVLWFADFREQSVLLKDLTLLPKNLKPIKGVINNFNIELADYVNVSNKNKKISKKISKRTTKNSCKTVLSDTKSIIDGNRNHNDDDTQNNIHNDSNNEMTDIELRLSGTRVVIINNYENPKPSEIINSL